jgi:hypothetical protein
MLEVIGDQRGGIGMKMTMKRIAAVVGAVMLVPTISMGNVYCIAEEWYDIAYVVNTANAMSYGYQLIMPAQVHDYWTGVGMSLDALVMFDMLYNNVNLIYYGDQNPPDPTHPDHYVQRHCTSRGNWDFMICHPVTAECPWDMNTSADWLGLDWRTMFLYSLPTGKSKPRLNADGISLIPAGHFREGEVNSATDVKAPRLLAPSPNTSATIVLYNYEDPNCTAHTYYLYDLYKVNSKLSCFTMIVETQLATTDFTTSDGLCFFTPVPGGYAVIMTVFQNNLVNPAILAGMFVPGKDSNQFAIVEAAEPYRGTVLNLVRLK